MKRIISGLSVIILSFSMLLTSCSSAPKGYIESDGKKTTPETVMKIGDYNVSFDEYRYYYLNSKTTYDGGDESYWEDNEDGFASVLTDTENYLKNMYAVVELAKENDITLDSDDQNEIEKQIENAKSTYGDEYEKNLEESYMSEEIYRDSLEKRALSNKLFAYYFDEPGESALSDDEYRSYFTENYYHAMHILIDYESGEGAITYDNTKKKADEIYERAASGEDFWSLVLKYGCDPNMESCEDGYYIKKGDMSDSFFDTLTSLDVNGVSLPLQSANGFYIIKRLDITEEGITSEKESVLNGYSDENGDWHNGVYDDIFIDIYTEKSNDMKVVYDDCYSQISPLTMK